MDKQLEDLFGCRVTRLSVSYGEQDLVFWTENKGPIVYSTDADCCSETWFADITGVNALLGEVITTAEFVDMPGDIPPDGRTRQDVDTYYGIKLTTPKGDVDITYRNSSNGYYGGSLTGPTDVVPEAGVLRDITDDWSA